MTLCVSAPLRENSRFAMSTWTEVHVSEAGGPISTQKFVDLFFRKSAENFGRRGQFLGRGLPIWRARRENVAAARLGRIGRRPYRGLTPMANPSRRVAAGKREGDSAGRLVAEATSPGGERCGGVRRLAGASSGVVARRAFVAMTRASRSTWDAGRSRSSTWAALRRAMAAAPGGAGLRRVARQERSYRCCLRCRWRMRRRRQRGNPPRLATHEPRRRERSA